MTDLPTTSPIAFPTDFGALWAVMLPIMGVSVIIGLAIYVYFALALMTIAKKTNTPNGWLAWIPIANLYLMTQIGKVPWWTILVIFLGFIPFLGAVAVLAVNIWWWWKIAEARKFPGWFGVLMIVPVADLIIPGIIAWTESKGMVPSAPSAPAQQ